MSNQERLLSDTELRDRVWSTIRWHSSEMVELGKYRKLDTTERHNAKLLESEQMALDELMPLINTQKRLYAESVTDKIIELKFNGTIRVSEVKRAKNEWFRETEKPSLESRPLPAPEQRARIK